MWIRLVLEFLGTENDQIKSVILGVFTALFDGDVKGQLINYMTYTENGVEIDSP